MEPENEGVIALEGTLRTVVFSWLEGKAEQERKFKRSVGG